MTKKIIASFLLSLLLVIPFMLKANAEAPEPVIPLKDSWTREEVRELVNKYADKHGLSRQVLHKVISCESGYNHKAVNWSDSHKLSQGSHGAAQFSKETFAQFSKQMGAEYSDPYHPDQALDVAAWAISKGYGRHWTCYRK
jgi:soluble lytic murein transglycosylase-like protein